MIQKLNQLVDYIEEHLDEELSLGEAAKTLGLSEYHLKRTFSFIAGVSVGEYIRNRRLACANRELVEGQTVTAVAFNYGYQSLEGFSRAFREWSGYLPSEVIKNKIQKSYPRLSFYVDVRGGVSMEFRIEQKNKFNLVGVKQEVPIQFEGKNEAIQKLTQSITEEQKAEMHKLTDVYPYQVLNASYDFDDGRMNEQGKLTHMIGIATTKENSYFDLQQMEIEERTWAVFPNQGEFPRVLQETWGKIYSEWLPTSGYKLVEAPEISFTRFEGENTELYSEIWIAVSE